MQRYTSRYVFHICLCWTCSLVTESHREGRAEVKMLTVPEGLHNGKELAGCTYGPSRWNSSSYPSFKESQLFLLLSILFPSALHTESWGKYVPTFTPNCCYTPEWCFRERRRKQQKSRTYLISCASRNTLLPNACGWKAEASGQCPLLKVQQKRKLINQHINSPLYAWKE